MREEGAYYEPGGFWCKLFWEGVETLPIGTAFFRAKDQPRDGSPGKEQDDGNDDQNRRLAPFFAIPNAPLDRVEQDGAEEDAPESKQQDFKK